jgi:hypothetical protein
MPELHIEPQVAYDGTDGFSRIRGVHETNHDRLANVWIDRCGSGFSLSCTGDLFDGRKAWRAEILTPESEVLGEVLECLRVWHEVAVEAKKSSARSSPALYNFDFANDPRPLEDSLIRSRYIDQWDFSGDAKVLEYALPKLAFAGYKLFRAIFFPQRPGDPRDKVERLNRIGAFLADATRSGEKWIRFTSNCFYVPWNLIYSDKTTNEGPVDRRNFWGYQHLIEHAPEESTLALEMKDVPPLQSAVCLDDRIDFLSKLASTQDILDVLDGFDQSKIQKLSDKDQFSTALGAPAIKEHVFYFWCHGKGGGDKPPLNLAPFELRLSDDQPITPSDIAAFMGDQEFAHRPIVFLNLCQGGQPTSMFYRGFTDVFLNKKASVVIGPYADIPIVFAGKFAQRFFDRFLKPKQLGSDFPQVGRILLDLRRELFDTHNNPLGLLYSLYWGADIFLREPLKRKAPAA